MTFQGQKKYEEIVSGGGGGIELSLYVIVYIWKNFSTNCKTYVVDNQALEKTFQHALPTCLIVDLLKAIVMLESLLLDLSL